MLLRDPAGVRSGPGRLVRPSEVHVDVETCPLRVGGDLGGLDSKIVKGGRDSTQVVGVGKVRDLFLVGAEAVAPVPLVQPAEEWVKYQDKEERAKGVTLNRAPPRVVDGLGVTDRGTDDYVRVCV